MFRGKRFLVAWAAMALVALPSIARAGDVEEIKPTAYRTGRQPWNSSSGRSVTVWRAGEPQMASHRLQEADDQVAIPPLPPEDGGAMEEQGRPNGNGGEPLNRDASGNCPGGCTTGNCGSDGCTSGGCDPCGPCADGGCCIDPELCNPWWGHRSSIFGSYLYLHPSNADVAHAIQQNGTGGLGTTPDGRVGVVDQNYTSAYNAGFAVALAPCASIQATYTNFHSHNVDSLSAPDVLGGTVASLVMHPESINAGSTSAFVEAAADIDFQTADLEYRRLLAGGCRFALNYDIGVRYAKMNQSFWQIGQFSPPTGTIRTSTNSKFEGAGLRAGLDGQQRIGQSGWGIYGKTFINVLFGTANNNYDQFNLTTESTQANSNWADERVVPVWEYEVGINWTSRCGHWRFTTGYYTAFWFNSVTTSQYIQAVQTANYVNLGETVTFDGLVSRVEFRF